MFFSYPFLNYFLIYYYMDLEVPLCKCGYGQFYVVLYITYLDIEKLGSEKLPLSCAIEVNSDTIMH